MSKKCAKQEAPTSAAARKEDIIKKLQRQRRTSITNIFVEKPSCAAWLRGGS